MKKITALLGSPRAGGNSEQLTEALLRGATKAGYEGTRIRLSTLDLKGCLDCRECWTSGAPCIIPDDMGKVHEAIRESEAIVFASPLYWYSWSAQIKPVWDRFLPFLSDRATWDLRGKTAIMIGTAGDDKPDVFRGLRFSFEISCELLGMLPVEPLMAYGVFDKGDVTKGDWLSMAESLGASL
ncbi:MAG: flavodoxin family protein [Synergistota bacterium]|nr:flavodoxin family protein [Synergistota bacterium]